MNSLIELYSIRVDFFKFLGFTGAIKIIIILYVKRTTQQKVTTVDNIKKSSFKRNQFFLKFANSEQVERLKNARAALKEAETEFKEFKKQFVEIDVAEEAILKITNDEIRERLFDAVMDPWMESRQLLWRARRDLASCKNQHNKVVKKVLWEIYSKLENQSFQE